MTIPNYIKFIEPFAFCDCPKLRTVEISPESELQTIGKKAFADTSIEKFTISPHITKICKGSFRFCIDLQTFEIPNNSILKTIEKDAFKDLPIERFTIPSSCTNLEEGWRSGTKKLKKIELSLDNPIYKKYEDKMIIKKSNEEEENYDVLVFCERDIEKVTIPIFIKKIDSFAFQYCERLKEVEILPNSDLEIIDIHAFNRSSIEKFTVPPHLTLICEGAFSNSKICMFEIPENSELKTIEKEAFTNSSIESFTFSPHITQISESLFQYCGNIQSIQFQECFFQIHRLDSLKYRQISLNFKKDGAKKHHI